MTRQRGFECVEGVIAVAGNVGLCQGVIQGGADGPNSARPRDEGRAEFGQHRGVRRVRSSKNARTVSHFKK